MLLAFFFPPSPLEIMILAGACFFVLLPEIHRGYCYARWFKSGDARWLERDEQWKPQRWMFAAAWVLAWLTLAVAFAVQDYR